MKHTGSDIRGEEQGGKGSWSKVSSWKSDKKSSSETANGRLYKALYRFSLVLGDVRVTGTFWTEGRCHVTYIIK